jgi:hypothetical protein
MEREEILLGEFKFGLEPEVADLGGHVTYRLCSTNPEKRAPCKIKKAWQTLSEHLSRSYTGVQATTLL